MPQQQLQPKSGFASACLTDSFWTLAKPDERLAGRTWEIILWTPTAHNILPLLSQWLQIVRDLVYKLSPDRLLLNVSAAFSTSHGTIFLKHFCSVSESLSVLLHLSVPTPCNYSVFLCPFLFYILYLLVFRVSVNKVNRLFYSFSLFFP